MSAETLQRALTSSASRGTFAGLIVGKLAGIVLVAWEYWSLRWLPE